MCLPLLEETTKPSFILLISIDSRGSFLLAPAVYVVPGHLELIRKPMLQ